MSKEVTAAPAPKTLYEETHRITPLVLAFVVVNDGQGEAIAALFKAASCFATFTFRGHGTAPKKIYEVWGLGGLKKDVVIGVIRRSEWENLKQSVEARFGVSKLSKGIGFTVPLDSVAGVSIYKMLSNTRFFEKPIHRRKKKGEIK